MTLIIVDERNFLAGHSICLLVEPPAAVNPSWVLCLYRASLQVRRSARYQELQANNMLEWSLQYFPKILNAPSTKPSILKIYDQPG